MPAELLVSRLGDQVWSALRRDGSFVELRVDDSETRPRVGDVYRARVTQRMAHSNAAFVDLGGDGSAFVAAGDPAATGGDGVGGERLVQVVREPVGEKAARVSGRIALVGPHLVITPTATGVGVSRRVRDPARRAELAATVTELASRQGWGVVARASAAPAKVDALEREARDLAERWTGVETAFAVGGPNGPLLREVPHAPRMLRDHFAVDDVIVDDSRDQDDLRAYAAAHDPAVVPRIRRCADRTVFERYELDQLALRATGSRVRLESGGHLVIQATEALVAIDVNTAGARAPQRETNLEAVAAVARELRLRDLGGTIVIDLPAPSDRSSRSELVRALQVATADDPERCRVDGLSELGLLTMTRAWRRRSLHATLTSRCGGCGGCARVPGPRWDAARASADRRRREASP